VQGIHARLSQLGFRELERVVGCDTLNVRCSRHPCQKRLWTLPPASPRSPQKPRSPASRGGDLSGATPEEPALSEEEGAGLGVAAGGGLDAAGGARAGTALRLGGDPQGMAVSLPGSASSAVEAVCMHSGALGHRCDVM
jgi:hypothetical protein